ncbi:MAG: AAA family ATPase [Treponema sp.]|jgi:DNA transposition AAA+ family ATPase|nr:AAA family ATPase [Treponema sp.]
MELSKFLEMNGLTFGAAARLTGYDRTTVSRIARMEYPNWETKQVEIMRDLVTKGYSEEGRERIRVNTDVMVVTPSVSDFQSLAGELADPDGTLSSSIGMAIGPAERGKTYTSKWFCRNNDNAAYILYVDGFSPVQILRDICDAVAHTRPYSMSKCITVLEEHCKYQRRLIIIDEADKCPVKALETLRGVNERCNLPILLAGEEGLKAKIDQVPRLRSRIRKPVVLFGEASEVDVATYYMQAAGISIGKDIAISLTRRSRGGFRTIVNEAGELARMANTSGIKTITEALVRQLS